MGKVCSQAFPGPVTVVLNIPNINPIKKTDSERKSFYCYNKVFCRIQLGKKHTNYDGKTPIFDIFWGD
jgi:hypothetical protein